LIYASLAKMLNILKGGTHFGITLCTEMKQQSQHSFEGSSYLCPELSAALYVLRHTQIKRERDEAMRPKRKKNCRVKSKGVMGLLSPKRSSFPLQNASNFTRLHQKSLNLKTGVKIILKFEDCVREIFQY